jgi:hypothetical protein
LIFAAVSACFFKAPAYGGCKSTSVPLPLTAHVAQFSFYDKDLASIFTIRQENDTKLAYNWPILRLYGLFHDLKKSVKKYGRRSLA